MEQLTKKQHLELYRYLRLTRALEDWIFYICANQNPQKPLIIGKGYLSTGQEATSIGAAYALEKEDWIAQSHRDFGALLIRGLTPRELLLQYFSKETGPTKGRDANVHLGHTGKHVLGFISHMGAMVPVANGVAFAMKYKKKKAWKDFVVVGVGGVGSVNDYWEFMKRGVDAVQSATGAMWKPDLAIEIRTSMTKRQRI